MNIETIKNQLILVLSRLYQLETAAGYYDWTGKFITETTNFETTVILIAKLGFNIFYMLSIFFAGYKLLQAWIIYKDRAVFPQTKVQALHEVMEPVKGLIYFVAALTVIRIIVEFVFEGTINPELI